MKQADRPEKISELLQAARHFCSFSERCTSEVTGKLRSLGAETTAIPPILHQLRQEKFLDDERYARAFTRGKFRNNHWGRIKIRYELEGKGIPDDIILLGLDEIGEDEYLDMIRNLVQKKSSEIKGEKKLTVRNKIFTFVSGKGFETDLITSIIKELNI